MDIVDKVMRWESGEMTDAEEVIEFFQELIDTGAAWTLQGSYGRDAQALIDNGHCHERVCPECGRTDDCECAPGINPRI